MHYAEFLQQYQKAHDDWGDGTIKTAEAGDEIARLRTLVASIEPVSKRDQAEWQLGEFEQEISPTAQERMARAVSVIGEAGSDEGTVAQRIARVEQGLKDVTSIANESDNPNERFAILSMNEWLATDLATLRRLDAAGAADDDRG